MITLDVKSLRAFSVNKAICFEIVKQAIISIINFLLCYKVISKENREEKRISYQWWEDSFFFFLIWTEMWATECSGDFYHWDLSVTLKQVKWSSWMRFLDCFPNYELVHNLTRFFFFWVVNIFLCQITKNSWESLNSYITVQ